ncbi:MAG TPA: N-acetylmuramoyl-L-alanine amidase [Chitinophagaceae bacterium]|nr:N-acetylmuramoyl-L-alanine amidase [Chitinophagaceae bacterium]
MKLHFTVIFLMIVCVIIYSCTQSRYAATNKVYKAKAKEYARLLKEYPVKDSAGLAYSADWAGTTNFTMRRPNYVIIHHTAQNSCEQTLKTFTSQDSRAVSAHYVICKDGTVHHQLNDMFRAHHAGVSKWGNTTDLNSSSIGIELDNNGFESFSEAQISSLTTLLDRLKRAYSIPVANFIGHADIAPGRKIDPNRNFPWQKLAQNGFGHWYDTVNVQVPSDFNPLQALRIIGYDIKNEKNAIQSYKIHFVQQDTTNVIFEEDKKIIFDLLKKYQ